MHGTLMLNIALVGHNCVKSEVYYINIDTSSLVYCRGLYSLSDFKFYNKFTWLIRIGPVQLGFWLSSLGWAAAGGSGVLLPSTGVHLPKGDPSDGHTFGGWDKG